MHTTQRKHFKFGDLQHAAYLPAQPVLSSRSVNIDLPGTRTYRQKSTLDILEEHQRLIRTFYKKPRISASAPPGGRSVPSSRSPTEHSVRKVNIEVTGRPVPHRPEFSFCHTENTPAAQRRPRTTGQLKYVRPLTVCHLTDSHCKDLLAVSYNSQELSRKLHTYWTSQNNTLATGTFVRGQKRPEDVPPTLDSWLTFGGGSGVHSQGVIDAFANFQNSEEFYNIEGSVGSKVARQLQRGDRIRIGINGALQTQDLKVNTRNKDNTPAVKLPFMKADITQEGTEEVREELLLQGEESASESSIQNTELEKEQEVHETEQVKRADDVTDDQSSESPSDDDFGELIISSFDDFQESATTYVGIRKNRPQEHSEMPIDQESHQANIETVLEASRLATPLSWSDQCSKSNVKIIHPRLTDREVLKPIVSETFPVKFEKLTEANLRPKLSETSPNGYKIKQRSAHRYNNSSGSASKVKVVYCDQLTAEEDETVNQLSIDHIIQHKLEGRNQENTSSLFNCGTRDVSDKPNGRFIKQVIPFQLHRGSSSKSEPRSNLPTSSSSVASDRGSVHSLKLMVTPVHSSANHHVGNLRIMSTGAHQRTSSGQDVLTTVRTPGKLVAAKPLHRPVVGQGGSSKTGMQQAEPTEYIKITSQLKVPPASAPAVSPSHHSTIFRLSQVSQGRTTPQDLDYQVMDKIQLGSEMLESSLSEVEVSNTSYPRSPDRPIPTPATETSPAADERCTKTPEPPASTTVAISIPTADEESFCQSLSKHGTIDELTVK